MARLLWLWIERFCRFDFLIGKLDLQRSLYLVRVASKKKFEVRERKSFVETTCDVLFEDAWVSMQRCNCEFLVKESKGLCFQDLPYCLKILAMFLMSLNDGPFFFLCFLFRWDLFLSLFFFFSLLSFQFLCLFLNFELQWLQPPFPWKPLFDYIFRIWLGNIGSVEENIDVEIWTSL